MNARINTRMDVRELHMAYHVQQKLLPDHVPRIPDIHFGVLNVPYRFIGGDYYDFIKINDKRLGVTIADACGHDLSAALIITIVHVLLRIEAMKNVSPDRVLKRVNNFLYREMMPNMFVTAFYGVLDLKSYQLEYANAGHPAPILLQNGSGRVKSLPNGGMPLGVSSDIPYEYQKIYLEPGDTMLLYTDGITDATNGAAEEFSVDRLKRILRSYREDDHQSLVDFIYAKVKTFMESPRQDDVTLVTVRREQ